MTTSAVMTEAAGATMLVPNAVTRADPTTPLASPLGSWLRSPMMRPPNARCTAHLTGRTLADPLATCPALAWAIAA